MSILQNAEMNIEKQKRIIDNELLETVRNFPCIACNYPPRSHPHHITSRGSGGGDVANNLISLCMEHHREVHRSGLTAMANKYGAIKYWLELAGWEYSEYRKKWIIKTQN